MRTQTTSDRRSDQAQERAKDVFVFSTDFRSGVIRPDATSPKLSEIGGICQRQHRFFQRNVLLAAVVGFEPSRFHYTSNVSDSALTRRDFFAI